MRQKKKRQTFKQESVTNTQERIQIAEPNKAQDTLKTNGRQHDRRKTLKGCYQLWITKKFDEGSLRAKGKDNLTKKSKKRRRRWKTTHKDDKVPEPFRKNFTHQKARHNRPCLRAQDKQEDSIQ